jgi:hypothetical protein
MAVFREFNGKRRFEKSINATFISIIPKKVGAVDIKDFRPFSVVSLVYKMISMVLANRLKQVLENECLDS